MPEFGKVSLDYDDMYEKIYDSYQDPNNEKYKKGIYEVLYYCIYDCISLHALSFKCKILLDTFLGSNTTKMSPTQYINSGSTMKLLSVTSDVAEEHNYIIESKH